DARDVSAGLRDGAVQGGSRYCRRIEPCCGDEIDAVPIAVDKEAAPDPAMLERGGQRQAPPHMAEAARSSAARVNGDRRPAHFLKNAITLRTAAITSSMSEPVIAGKIGSDNIRSYADSATGHDPFM